MKRIFNFVLCKLVLCVLIGIVLGKYISADIIWLIVSCFSLLVFSIIAYANSPRHFHQKIYFGCCIYLLSIVVGWLNYNLHQPTQYPQHFTHYATTPAQAASIQISISEVLKPSNYYQKYTANLQLLKHQKCFGKLLIYIPKHLNSELQPGHTLAVYASIEDLPTPKNPYQFNYATYLENQHIYGQLHLDSLNYQILATSISSIAAKAHGFRTKLENELTENGLSGAELAITKALFLGQRNDISKELYNTYVNAGVIHLLAISGLHIGIITSLLMLLCYPLGFLKNGRIYSSILVVSALWLFALITGFSASVTRSVVMFSLITITVYLKRPQNTLHNVVASAFLLLLWHPNFLFEVGFQLSYCAVIGIVILQPEMQKRIHFRHKIFNYFFGIITTTLAAQIAVLPLSLYYFHQFPGLFFIGNLILIPTLFIILGYGFLVLTAAYLGFLNAEMVFPLRMMITYMNTLIKWIASKKHFLFQHIYFDSTALFITYATIIFLIYAFIYRSSKSLKLGLFGIVCIQLYFMHINQQQNTTQKLIVFQQSRQHIIGLQKGKSLELFTADTTQVSYLTNSYQNATNCMVHRSEPANVFCFAKDTILVIDEKSCYETKFKANYIVLTKSPYINLERVIAYHHPKKIIADGSNYLSSVTRWKQTCKQQKIPFHNTYEKGAFILK